MRLFVLCGCEYFVCLPVSCHLCGMWCVCVFSVRVLAGNVCLSLLWAGPEDMQLWQPCQSQAVKSGIVFP